MIDGVASNFGLDKFASLANEVLLGVTQVRDMEWALSIETWSLGALGNTVPK